MADWNFNLTVISATNLPVVRTFLQMRVYAEVSINGEANLTWKTPVDTTRGTNPCWNSRTPYVLPAKFLQGKAMLVIKLYCERSFKDDKYVGEVNLSIKELFENRESQDVYKEYSVDRVNEDGHFGVLKISYSFCEKISELPMKDATAEDGQGNGEGSALLYKVVQIGASLILESLVPGSSEILEFFQE